MKADPDGPFEAVVRAYTSRARFGFVDASLRQIIPLTSLLLEPARLDLSSGSAGTREGPRGLPAAVPLLQYSRSPTRGAGRLPTF